MIFKRKMYTVESVLKGHPDKICDQISDGLLDAYLKADSNSHTAIECLGTGNTLIVAGEIRSNAVVDIEENCMRIYSDITGNPKINVINMLSQQSGQLSDAVSNGGAGDQGIMYGYACNNKRCNFLPYGYWLVNLISRRLDLLREKTKSFLPDGKVQATLLDDEIIQLSVNVQHPSNTDMNKLNSLIKENCLFDIDENKVKINPNCGFICGGIENDTGLTGRKIIVDTYGGLVPHGGGAFSGKDPSKVDRSAAYMCRFVAKNLVANGIVNECCVSVAYNFGEEKPIMIHVDTDEELSNKILLIIYEKFDFRPRAIIERLNLKKIQYQPTALYGHFTNPSYPWEQIVDL